MTANNALERSVEHRPCAHIEWCVGRGRIGTGAGRSTRSLALMSKTLYCWRCKMPIPMLEESEWERLAPYLTNAIEQIKRYREAHGVSIAEAKTAGYGREALALYFDITGFRETNPDALWHHRFALFGPPCHNCGKPLRTPQAKLCAECGAVRPNFSSSGLAEARRST